MVMVIKILIVIILVCSAMNHSEEEKRKLLEVQSNHLAEAAAAREYMNSCIIRCKSHLPLDGSNLGVNLPLSGPPMAHYCFDFAQQVGNV